MVSNRYIGRGVLSVVLAGFGGDMRKEFCEKKRKINNLCTNCFF